MAGRIFVREEILLDFPGQAATVRVVACTALLLTFDSTAVEGDTWYVDMMT